MIKKRKMALSLTLAMVLFAGCGKVADESSEDVDKGKRDINQVVDAGKNSAPTVDAGDDANITEGDSFSRTPTSSDIDGHIPDGSTIWSKDGETITFPKTDFSVGEHNLTVTVTDNEGLSATDFLTLIVKTPYIPLLSTGQSVSYYAGDDGNLTKGAVRSFTRDDINETVTDNITGLMWQDDVDSGVKSLEDALTCCTNLTLGGYEDWRLPEIKELVYLVDRGSYDPSLDSAFQNSINTGYHSSTMKNQNQAWYVNFYNGTYGYLKADLYTRCVRETE